MDQIQDDEQALRDLSEKICLAENTGNREFLASILAPRLAFQRSDEQKTVDNEEAFLQKVTSDGTRTHHIIEPIEIYGERAIVKCVISVDGKAFHNLRLFVRRGGEWKLLGWANEPL